MPPGGSKLTPAAARGAAATGSSAGGNAAAAGGRSSAAAAATMASTLRRRRGHKSTALVSAAPSVAYLYPPFDRNPASAQMVLTAREDVVQREQEVLFKIRVHQSKNIVVRVSPKEGRMCRRGERQKQVTVTVDVIKDQETLNKVAEGTEDFKVLIYSILARDNDYLTPVKWWESTDREKVNLEVMEVTFVPSIGSERKEEQKDAFQTNGKPAATAAKKKDFQPFRRRQNLQQGSRTPAVKRASILKETDAAKEQQVDSPRPQQSQQPHQEHAGKTPASGTPGAPKTQAQAKAQTQAQRSPDPQGGKASPTQSPRRAPQPGSKAPPNQQPSQAPRRQPAKRESRAAPTAMPPALPVYDGDLPPHALPPTRPQPQPVKPPSPPASNTSTKVLLPVLGNVARMLRERRKAGIIPVLDRAPRRPIYVPTEYGSVKPAKDTKRRQVDQGASSDDEDSSEEDEGGYENDDEEEYSSEEERDETLDLIPHLTVGEKVAKMMGLDRPNNKHQLSNGGHHYLSNNGFSHFNSEELRLGAEAVYSSNEVTPMGNEESDLRPDSPILAGCGFRNLPDGFHLERRPRFPDNSDDRAAAPEVADLWKDVLSKLELKGGLKEERRVFDEAKKQMEYLRKDFPGEEEKQFRELFKSTKTSIAKLMKQISCTIEEVDEALEVKEDLIPRRNY